MPIYVSYRQADETGQRRFRDWSCEDTRQSLIEARRAGIHPFCITIDREAKAYLPHMYGAANYIEIDNVKKLPLKAADIYRKLTT